MSLIEDMRIHSAVVWALLGADQNGLRTYGEASEILCRWDNVQTLHTHADGSSVGSRATIYMMESLEVDTMIARGTIATITNSEDPIASGAEPVMNCESIDTIDGDETLFIIKI